MTPGVVAESDLAGTLKSEYVFFDGERVARRDGATGTGGVFYYFSDHLKTASVITDSAGVIKAESDYYPWGRRTAIRQQRFQRLQIHRQEARHRDRPRLLWGTVLLQRVGKMGVG
jgi:hypothetical protein